MHIILKQPLKILLKTLSGLVMLPIVIVTTLVMTMQFDVAPAYATGVYDFPQTATEEWVLDQADILSRLSENRINTVLADVGQKTNSQIRFVTVHRLDYDETAESLTNQLFGQWFPTPEAQANQVLLVLDNVTNTSAIRVGDGAAEKLSAAIAQSVAQ